MRNRVTLWAEQDEKDKVFIALELNEADNNYTIHVFPADKLDQEWIKKMESDWRKGGDIDMPGHELITRDLTVQGELLPENLRPEKPHIASMTQTEWHFQVLSAKMSSLYKSELEELKERVDSLEDYSRDAWEQLKGFWTKVQNQINEKNIVRQHANELRKETDTLFEALKGLRNKADQEFKEKSQVVIKEFSEKLDQLEEKIESGSALRPLFDQLRSLQGNLKSQDLRHRDRQAIWNRIDSAFKTIKEKRGQSTDGGGAMSRYQRRIEGLTAARERMKKSVERDEKEMAFQDRRIHKTDGQLEMQLREAKKVMIEERLRSKKSKLEDIERTLQSIEGKMEKEKKRQQQQAEEKLKKDAIAKAKEELRSAHKEASQSTDVADDALRKAAEQINEQKSGATPTGPSTPAPEISELGEQIEDLIDTGLDTVSDIMQDAADSVRSIARVVTGMIDGEEE